MEVAFVGGGVGVELGCFLVVDVIELGFKTELLLELLKVL